MGKIITDEVLNKLKLDFSLFSLSKNPVEFYVFWVKNLTGPESIFSGPTWENKLIKTGYINPDGTIEEKEIDSEGIRYVPADERRIVRSPIIEKTLSVGENTLKSRLQIMFEWAEFIDFDSRAVYKTAEKSDKNGYDCEKIIETKVETVKSFGKTRMSHWGPDVLKDEERYVVAIFPNSVMPPIVRLYENANFDIVNFDDLNCIYNSYNLNIFTETKESINYYRKKRLQNIPITKFDNYYKKFLEIFGQENHSIENGWETYSNDAIDFEISHNSSAYGVLGIRFGKYSLENIPDKCTEEYTGDINDVLDFIEEITDENIDISVAELSRSRVSPDGSYNRIKLIANNRYVITLHSAGFFSVGILYIADIEKNMITMHLIDLQDQAIVSTTKLTNTGNILLLCHETDIKELSYNMQFNIADNWDIKEISMMPVNILIWKIHNLIENSTFLTYSGNDWVYAYQNSKFIDINNNVLDKHFARGLFGELIQLD